MIDLNRERIKSIVLFSLVIISFILTTRIWFNVSIEGIFLMSRNNNNDKYNLLKQYDISKHLKPNKIVINMEGQRKILLENKPGLDFYDSVLNESKSLLVQLLSNDYAQYQKVSKIQLESLKNEKNIALILKEPIETGIFSSLLKINKNFYSDIKYYSSIVISPYTNKLYIYDEKQDMAFEFFIDNISTNLSGLIGEIIKQNTAYYIYLSDNFPIIDDMFGFEQNAIAFADTTKLPILDIEPELDINEITIDDVESFFDDDISRISSLHDVGRVIEFTDRDDQRVRIENNGQLEYTKSSALKDMNETISLQEALTISANFIEYNLGFPKDTLVSEISLQSNEGIPTYTIKYKFRHEGVPIIMEKDFNSYGIEVKIEGKQVKSYKRHIWTITEKTQTKEIITIIDVLDTIAKHNKKKYIPQENKISLIKDIYIAYFERKSSLIPVWAVEAIIESKNAKGEIINITKQIIINPETGVIIDEQ